MNWREMSLDLTMLVMEVCWLYALFALATTMAVIEAPGLSLPLLAILGLLLAAFYITRFLQHFDLPLAILRVVGVGLGALCILIVLRTHFAGSAGLYDGTVLIRAQVLALAIGAGLWWRGTRLAHREVSFGTILTSFRIGIFALIFTVVVEQLLPGPRAATGVALPFFAFGLLALALGHWRGVSRGQPWALQGRWLGILIATIATVVLFGMLFSLLPSVNAGEIELPAAGGIGRFFERAISLILKPIEFLAKLITSLLSRIQIPEVVGEGGGEEGGGSLADMLKEAEEYINPLPDWVRETLKWAFVVLIGGWLVRWLARAIGLPFARGQRGRREVRESVFSKDALRQDLDSLVQGILSRFKRRERASSLPSFANLTGEALDNIRSVCQLYLDLLNVGVSRGFERKDWQTPLELQVGLENIFPSREVARITLAFTRARYGLHPPTSEEVRELRQDWQRLQQ